MTKTITLTVSFTVEERDEGDAETLRRNLVSYLTSPDAPLRDDYGPEAWGGYDGAYITAARVTASSCT